MATAVASAHADIYVLSAGALDGNKRLTLGRQFAPEPWFRPELSLSAWDASNGTAFQVSAVPLLRYQLSQKWFIEGGIGLTYFSRADFAKSNLGSRFHFADQLGVGYDTAPNRSFGIRLSHFSNAGLKKPNPGIEVIEATFRYRF